jgi:iron complex transport system substrate-binding protein
MKRIIFTAVCCILTGILLAIGSRPASVSETGAAGTASAFRTVTDLQGNKVKLPPAKELQRVVIVSPLLVSTFASLGISQAEIVGAHKIAFANANKKLLDMLLPKWRDIPTGFLTGFKSNTEELLKLDPDVILVYGNFQKEGLQGISIPVLDFFIDNHDNEVCSVATENLMREVFETDSNIPPLQKEWDQAKKQAADLLANREGPEKKGMMIMSNTGDKITVLGIGSCGDDWLKKSGLVNVADVHGAGREVAMEQLYAWNPDIIYVFMGIPASDYIKGNIPGQDWRHITAARNGAVYDIPRGLMNWGTPNADSPLTLLWLVSKNYPELLNEADFSDIMKSFYFRRYSIELSDELMQTTLYPNGK